jgi:hypothetical protein
VISRQVGQVAGRLTAILREMELNDLGSASTRELMDSEIVQPLGQLQSSKLADMRPLLENLVGTPRLDTLPNPASLDAATVAAELDNRQAAHDKQREVVTEMEVILARMQQWESFVDVLNQLRQVIKLQSGVLDDVERQRKSLTDDLFDDEIDDEIDDDAAEGGEADDEGHTAGSSDDAS